MDMPDSKRVYIDIDRAILVLGNVIENCGSGLERDFVFVASSSSQDTDSYVRHEVIVPQFEKSLRCDVDKRLLEADFPPDTPVICQRKTVCLSVCEQYSFLEILAVCIGKLGEKLLFSEDCARFVALVFDY